MPTSWQIWRRQARELRRAIWDLLLPPACPGCGGMGHGLCRPCRQDLARRPQLGCPRCGDQVLVAGQSCGSDHRDLQGLRHLVAPFQFAGTGGALVRRLKLDGDPAAGHWLARAMADAWLGAVGREWRRAELVAVPLHKARRRERGFDQAEWLANRIGSRLGYVVRPGVLVRTRATLPQGDPRVMSRQGNVDGAFALRRSAHPVGARVILVDDVFTSGATARNCAALLRNAGATEVAILTSCRS